MDGCPGKARRVNWSPGVSLLADPRSRRRELRGGDDRGAPRPTARRVQRPPGTSDGAEIPKGGTSRDMGARGPEAVQEEALRAIAKSLLRLREKTQS